MKRKLLAASLAVVLSGAACAADDTAKTSLIDRPAPDPESLPNDAYANRCVTATR